MLGSSRICHPLSLLLGQLGPVTQVFPNATAGPKVDPASGLGTDSAVWLWIRICLEGKLRAIEFA